MNPSVLPILLTTGVFVGAAAGYLGSFMVLKRMSLVGDALSHVALPGIAIALLLGQNPILGAFVILILAVTGIWYLQQHSRVYPDALVGIFFTASLSVGILITPEPDLLEALFGSIEKVSLPESLVAAAVSVTVIAATWYISKKIILSTISEDLSRTTDSKLSVSVSSLIYYLLVGTIVALGIKFVGTLLTGALVIIPAASAKNFARSLSGYTLWSAALGILSAVTGIFLSAYLNLPPGPIVVLSSAFFFLLTLLFRSSKT